MIGDQFIATCAHDDMKGTVAAGGFPLRELGKLAGMPDDYLALGIEFYDLVPDGDAKCDGKIAFTVIGAPCAEVGNDFDASDIYLRARSSLAAYPFRGRMTPAEFPKHFNPIC